MTRFFSAAFLAAASLAVSVSAQAQSFTFKTITIKGALSTNTTAFGSSSSQLVGYEVASNLTAEGFIETGSSVKTVKVKGAIQTELYNYANSLYIGQSSTGSLITSFTMTPSGVQKTLQFPKSDITEAYGINNAHTIVGYYEALVGPVQEIGFSYSNGKFTSIQFPGAFETLPSGINNSGVIVGTYGLFNSDTLSGFILKNGAFTTVQVPGSFNTTVQGINDNGVMTGYYDTVENGPNIGFTYDGTKFISFSVPGGLPTYAYNINNAGQVIGFSVGPKGDTGFVATPVAASPK